jgi:glucose/arabinose dehydrogenase
MSLQRMLAALCGTTACWLSVTAYAQTANAVAAAETQLGNLVLSEYGPTPTLPAPDTSLIPTVETAKAIGWPNGGRPASAPGTLVTAYAVGLQHPRSLYVLPNGDVLVAETDAPPKPDDSKGISGEIHKLVMRHAGSGEHPSPNRIVLLRDTGHSGHAQQRFTFLTGLNSPFGMVLVGENLYVADTDAVLRFPYESGDTTIRARPTKLTDLPAGTINHHWTKSLTASPDGKTLYVGVGSNSNAAENGLAAEYERAAIWKIDVATGNHELFATGTRNPTSLAWEPESRVLWAAVNERDEIGDHLPPDYITSLHQGDFYGWPFSYYGQHVDDRVKPQNAALVAKAIAPDYAVGAHTAPLGLTWAAGSTLPAPFQHGMFVSQHGSWNRKAKSGYQVIFVPFDQGKPDGMPTVLLAGFLTKDGKDAQGRPVALAMDSQGGLLVADDVGGSVWRVSAAGVPSSAARNPQGGH